MNTAKRLSIHNWQEKTNKTIFVDFVHPILVMGRTSRSRTGYPDPRAGNGALSFMPTWCSVSKFLDISHSKIVNVKLTTR